MPKIKKTDIEKLECPENKNLCYLWDSALPGFGIRATSAGVKSFVLRYRHKGKQRIKTIGRASGDIALDITTARERARNKLNEVYSGSDPFISTARKVENVRDLSEAFQEGRKFELKPKTLESYVSLWKHINKYIGDEAVGAIDDSTVDELRRGLGEKKTTFNRCLSLMLSALKWRGLLTESHAFKRARKYKEKPRQRILSKQESGDFYKALGEYKENRLPGWRYADLFILLLLTGLRRDEWRLGKWEWVNWEDCLYQIPDNKTGGRTVYLSSLALEVLEDKHKKARRPKKGYIFPAASGDKRKPLSWTWRLWNEMREKIGLPGFRIHDMRHTAGSYAHSLGGLTQRQVADFLGHSRLETSSRYIHDDQKREGAEIAAKAIAESWKLS